MSDIVHIVCPHCLASNRLPRERLISSPNCGKCKKSLFSGQVATLSGVSFAAMIERNEIPMVVDFWAPWCGPCKSMAPAFEQAAKVLEPKIRMAKVNIDTEQTIANRFKIQSIPTLVYFFRGKELARQNGAMDTASIIRWVQSVSEQF
ncbi:thioredoxin TrxC [Zhongshania sp. BJYM1]|uniref:thioredoxin TrxC n=1 Tax=Zhongshania aquatica TaxID=2965069 RepID=UPI0022B45603|nr:thioredoxin TrxC [Marortus sp. BJYM1]